jgi:hypothetical protein
MYIQLFKPSVNKTPKRNIFPIKCIEQWNNLDENIALNESVLTSTGAG